MDVKITGTFPGLMVYTNNVALMLQQLKGLRSSIPYVMKWVLFVNKSCTKGESFLLKMDYRRARGCTCGQSISVQNFVEFSGGLCIPALPELNHKLHKTDKRSRI